MQTEPLILARPDHGDGITAVGVCIVFALGVMLGAVVGWRVRPMAGRNRKLRERAARPEPEVPRVARDVIREIHGKDIDDLDPAWKQRILVAVLDAQPLGLEAMRYAALAEYRYLTRREKLTAGAEDDE